ncbi:MAG: c-type cytochrome [Planctomycetales bacterium]|nr:c-type cytochrome [Planctomycetales bacterium]
MDNNSLMNHSYDGIQEYDNPLPGWWKWTFVGTIVFSVLYGMYWHVGAPGRTLAERYDVELDTNMRLQFAEIGDLTPDADTIMLATTKKGWLAIGKSVFRTNCISCHGKDGEGKVGPNLADDVYKNVKKVEDLARVIASGAGNGAMPAWANRLQGNEVVLVAAYVASLRNTLAADQGKGPEGSEIAPWPEPPAEEPEVPPAESGEATGTAA